MKLGVLIFLTWYGDSVTVWGFLDWLCSDLWWLLILDEFVWDFRFFWQVGVDLLGVGRVRLNLKICFFKLVMIFASDCWGIWNCRVTVIGEIKWFHIELGFENWVWVIEDLMIIFGWFGISLDWVFHWGIGQILVILN